MDDRIGGRSGKERPAVGKSNNNIKNTAQTKEEPKGNNIDSAPHKEGTIGTNDLCNLSEKEMKILGELQEVKRREIKKYIPNIKLYEQKDVARNVEESRFGYHQES